MRHSSFSNQSRKGFGDMPQLRSIETEQSTFSEKKFQSDLKKQRSVSAVKVADFAQKVKRSETFSSVCAFGSYTTDIG